MFYEILVYGLLRSSRSFHVPQTHLQEYFLKRLQTWHQLTSVVDGFCCFSPPPTRQVLRWNPQCKRKRGYPWNTWRRDTEKEMNALGYKWRDLEELARHRGRWRAFVNAYGQCSIQSGATGVSKQVKARLHKQFLCDNFYLLVLMNKIDQVQPRPPIFCFQIKIARVVGAYTGK